MGWNNILEDINHALDAPETPTWGRVLLRCYRDDHILLHQHLQQHAQTQDLLWKIVLGILLPALAAILVGMLKWLPAVLK